MEPTNGSTGWRTPPGRCQTWTNEHCFQVQRVPNAAAALAAGGIPEAVAACVDITDFDTPLILVGDTKNPTGPAMVYTLAEARTFFAAVKDGYYDDLVAAAEMATV